METASRDRVIIHGTDDGYLIQCFDESNYPATDLPIFRYRNYEVIALCKLYLGREMGSDELRAINLVQKGDQICLHK